MISLIAGLVLASGSVISIAIDEAPFELVCHEKDKAIRTITLHAHNRKSDVFLSNNIWVKSRIGRDKIYLERYDGGDSSSYFYHLWGISGYQGKNQIIAFHAESDGVQYIYWRELSQSNAFENGLVGYNGETLYPVCKSISAISDFADIKRRAESP